MRISPPRRMAVLRGACVAALAASAALTADSWHAERGFCPLKSACEKARESAFGSVLGIPTSVIGLLAFGGLFLMTFLPPGRARKFARPAALGGALVGTGLAVVQAFSLHVFCPLCVVADVSALVAGAAVVGWAKPKARRGKKRPVEPEFVGDRLRWALAAILAVVIPTGWPRESKPAWVEIHAPMEFADAHSSEEPEAASGEALVEPHAATVDSGSAAPAPRFESWTPATTSEPAPRALPESKEMRAARISIVEYLNPFCSHCRATHARLDRLLASMDVDVKRRRVYVWAQDEPPLWAKCLSCARGMGLEDRFFDELARTSGQDKAAIDGAATRAGIDAASLTMCRASAATLTRLQQERDLVIAAGIESLPTFDIGRRRLMGEQSEAELREALRAAAAGAASH